MIKINQAWLTTNYNCNYNCTWCYAKKSCKKKIMDLETCKCYIDELKKIGIKNIVLIGGEPTIYPYFLELLDYININNINAILATNGDKFSNYFFTKKSIDRGLKNVNISLKTIYRDDYKILSNNSDISNVIDGYNNLKNLGCSVTMSYVILNQTVEEINKLKNFLKENSINKIFFQLYKPTVGENQVSYSCQELAIKCKDFYDVFKDSNIKFAFEISIPLCLFEKNFLKILIDKKIITTCCHIRKGLGIVFDPVFNIKPCNHFIGYNLNDRKIYPHQVYDFWNNDINVIRFREIINKYPSDKCSDCQFWRICGGGCSIRWLIEKPDEIIKGIL